MIYIELLQHHPVLYWLLVFAFSLMVGSFLNVVIYRLPLMLKKQWRGDCEQFLAEEEGKTPDTSTTHTDNLEQESFNLVVPRSRCPQCGHLIGALENIPLLSWLVLRGCCRECRNPISIRYPLVELLSALLAVAVAWKFGVSLQALSAMVLTWVLISLSFIDYDHQYLPDNLTLPFLWVGLLLNMWTTFVDLQSAVVGAIAGYLSLWTVYQVFKKLTGKEGMGYGDFKLLALLGAWLGWQALPMLVVIASLLGSVVGLSLIALKKHARNKPIPFGPYLAIAGWVTLMWGDAMNTWYLGWIRAVG